MLITFQKKANDKFQSASLKDLCTEDKQRVANLINELARYVLIFPSYVLSNWFGPLSLNNDGNYLWPDYIKGLAIEQYLQKEYMYVI